MDGEAMDFAPSHLDERKAALARSAKRYLTKDEMRRRGCLFCVKMVRVTHDYIALVDVPEIKGREVKKGARLYFCQHEACPYRELDAVKKDYIEEYDKVVARERSTITMSLKGAGFKQTRKSAPKRRKAKKGEAA